jgi:hypothetical protein
MLPIERGSVGDWFKGQRTAWSDTQGVANAEDLAIEAPIHLALNEAVQGKIHRDASGKQRNQDKGQRQRQQPTAQGSWDEPHGGAAVSR